MKNKKGFTLIELLVVISIIGFLSTLVTVSVASSRVKARDAKRISDAKMIQTALEMYFNDKEYYPTSINDSDFKKFIEYPQDPNEKKLYPYRACAYNATNEKIENCASPWTSSAPPQAFCIFIKLEGRPGSFNGNQLFVTPNKLASTTPDNTCPTLYP